MFKFHGSLLPHPLDRLCFVASHGMRTLSYAPETLSFSVSLPTDLDEIGHEMQQH